MRHPISGIEDAAALSVSWRMAVRRPVRSEQPARWTTGDRPAPRRLAAGGVGALVRDGGGGSRRMTKLRAAGLPSTGGIARFFRVPYDRSFPEADHSAGVRTTAESPPPGAPDFPPGWAGTPL